MDSLDGEQMIRFAVCDDNAEDLKCIEDIITSYKKTEMQIDTFSNPIELLNRIKEVRYDAFFLDMDMPEMTGLQVSSKIREIDMCSEIIFITVREELVFESITFKPFDFVRKRYIKEELIKTLDKLYKIIEINNFYIDENGYKIPVGEVRYIESENHKLKIFTSNNSFFYMVGRISEMEKNLKAYNYIRVHSGFLVNMKYIMKYRQNYVKLYCGTDIPVGRNYFKESKEEFLRYVRGR